VSVTAARPRTTQYGTQVSHAEGLRLMAKATGEFSPLLAVLSNAVAEDDEVLALLTSLAPGQIPTLIHCATTYLLASSPDEPLRAYLPCYAGGACRPMAEAYPVYREFCLRRETEIRALLASRTVQLTFPERAARFLLGLDKVAEFADGPIDLVEVGCSAGLLLQVDRYRYDFGRHGMFGDPASPVTVKVDLLGAAAAAPTRMPQIGARCGIDLHPPDPADPDEVEWILAAIGPERVEARRNTAKALAMAAARPIEVIKGDALAQLPRVAARMTGTLCVANSHCLYQWPAELCEAFDALVCELSRQRDVHRISVESQDRGPAAIMHLLYRGGDVVSSTTIGGADKAGGWIDFDMR
jgi:hypothetical protein